MNKIWQSWQSFWFSDDQKWHSQILLWLGMGLFNLTSKIGGDFPSAQDPQKRKAVEDGGAGLTLPAKRAKGQFIQFIHLLTVNHFFFKEKTGLWHLAGQFFWNWKCQRRVSGTDLSRCILRSTRRWPNKPWRLWRMILNWRSFERVGRCWSASVMTYVVEWTRWKTPSQFSWLDTTQLFFKKNLIFDTQWQLPNERVDDVSPE